MKTFLMFVAGIVLIAIVVGGCEREETSAQKQGEAPTFGTIFGEISSKADVAKPDRMRLETLFENDVRTEGSRIIQLALLKDGTYEARTEQRESGDRGEYVHLRRENGKWTILDVGFWEE